MHSVPINLIADQEIEALGKRINVHDIETITLDTNGNIVNISLHKEDDRGGWRCSKCGDRVPTKILLRDGLCFECAIVDELFGAIDVVETGNERTISCADCGKSLAKTTIGTPLTGITMGCCKKIRMIPEGKY